jgi:hypothetical protein
MEDLIRHISGPNQKMVGLIKLPDERVVVSPSKWFSDRWFLRESNFAMNQTCVEISPFKKKEIVSNVFVGEKYLGHRVFRFLKNSSCSFEDAPQDIDFLSIIDPDNAFENLQKINFSFHHIRYFCIAINPLKLKDSKQNMRDVKGFMKGRAHFVAQNRTELLYCV